MKPYYEEKGATLYNGDCLEVLKALPDKSVNTCVTSPPYFGLRDYGTAKWEGGTDGCDHAVKKGGNGSKSAKQVTSAGTQQHQYRDACAKCGARRIDSQIGLEETPEQYVAKLVEVFREVRRVLRDDGTLWVNLGDTYWGGKGQSGSQGKEFQQKRVEAGVSFSSPAAHVGGKGKTRPQDRKHDAIKPKDLIGIPWMVAFALRADGWYLRSDIIWNKPNGMPESVEDRCSKSHEYIFMLAKSPRYYCNMAAIKEPAKDCSYERQRRGVSSSHKMTEGAPGQSVQGLFKERAPIRFDAAEVERVEWTPNLNRPQTRHALELAEQHGLTDAHIAAIRAVGITDTGKAQITQTGFGKNRDEMMRLAAEAKDVLGGYCREFLIGATANKRSVWTVPTRGYTDAHFATFPEDLIKPCVLAGCPEGGTVLDPFNGAGTTGVVTLKFGRKYIGLELNPEYVEMSAKRIGGAVLPLLDLLTA